MKDRFSALVIGSIFPILLLYYAIKSKSSKLKNFLWTVFFAVFGGSQLQHGDGLRHLNRIKSYYVGASVDDILNWTNSILNLQPSGSGVTDLYLHFVGIISGSLFQAPWLFFVIVGGVYGYFFSGSLLLVLSKYSKEKSSFFIILLIFLFFFIKGLNGIHSVRNWTAMWVCVYGLLNYAFSGKKKYLLYPLISPLIHFSYTVIAIPIFLSVLLKDWPYIIVAIFILSNFTTIIKPQLVVDRLNNLGATQAELVDTKLNAYYTDEKLDETANFEEQVQSGFSFHRSYLKSQIHRIPTNYVFFIFIFTGLFLRNFANIEKQIFSAGLLMISLSNMSWFISSLTSRTLIFSMILLFASLIIFSSNNKNFLTAKGFIFKGTVYLAIISYVPYFLYQFSAVLNFMSIFFLLGGPFLPLIDSDINISVLEAIKKLI